MRSLLAALVMTVALYQLSAGSADSVSWGPAEKGLRLGVTVRLDTGELRLAFQNVGSAEIDVLVGGRTGIGPCTR